MIPLSTYVRLDEARAALGCSEVAPRALPIAGGIACRGESQSWINTALGLCLRDGDAGAISTHDIDRLTAWYLDARLDAKVEVSCYAHESLMKRLVERGFVPTMFETTFVRSIDPADRMESLVPLGPDVTLQTVDPRASPARAEAIAWCVNRAFAPPNTEPRPADVDVSLACMRHPRTLTLGAFDGAAPDAACVGGAYLEVVSTPELAAIDPTFAASPPITFGALFGAAVAAPSRRRGIQNAMLAQRLRLAQSRGCAFVTIGGTPGAGTERNARRYGFQIAGYKVHMVKAFPG